MSKRYINIAITGLNIQDSVELKNQLCNIIQNNLIIQWKKASDINLDCLFIHETFFNTDGIKNILSKTNFPWLKISKNTQLSGKVQDNTLYLPLEKENELHHWLNQHIINKSPDSQTDDEIQAQSHSTEQTLQIEEPHHFNERFFKQMLTDLPKNKLHLYDNQGSIAIIDIENNSVWSNPNRLQPTTDLSFKYDLASTSDLVKVDRTESVILQDWLWNLFWNSPEFYQICPEDGHYRIHFWPKPINKSQRKKIFKLSACFIQGAKISKIAEQQNIPIHFIRQFIAANIAINNISKINIWDTHYTPPEVPETQADNSFIQSFIGKLRKKFGF